MGAALKKNQNYAELSYLRWTAWRVIDIETLERMQRRNYINHVREELKLHGMRLECGGGAAHPYYRIFKLATVGVAHAPAQPKSIEWQSTSAGIKEQAFGKVCHDALLKIDPNAIADGLEHV